MNIKVTKSKRKPNPNYIPPASVYIPLETNLKIKQQVNIQWANQYKLGKEVIYAPIMKGDKVIGMVKDVTPDYIYGVLFTDINNTLNQHYQTMSFELKF